MRMYLPTHLALIAINHFGLQNNPRESAIAEAIATTKSKLSHLFEERICLLSGIRPQDLEDMRNIIEFEANTGDPAQYLQYRKEFPAHIREVLQEHAFYPACVVFYQFLNTDTQPTIEALDQLLEKIKSILNTHRLFQGNELDKALSNAFGTFESSESTPSAAYDEKTLPVLAERRKKF